MAVNVLVCFGLPIGLMIWLVLKKKSTMRPILTGMLVFFVFQMILRIPLLQNVLAPQPWFQSMAKNIWVYALFLALTAGIFEEVGRFIGYKALLKRQNAWWDGFAFGVGHGGIEAVLLTGMTNINNLTLAFLINTGGYEAYAKTLDPGTAELIFQQMVQVGPGELLLAGLERVFVITIQIAFSVLVLYAVRKRNLLWLGLAVLLHTLVDAPPVILLNGFGWNVYLVEGLIGIMAVLAGVYLWRSHKAFLQMDGHDHTTGKMPRGPIPGYVPPCPYVPTGAAGDDSSQE
ncbi:YhfC family intramembrane metalloprotease [Oscillospiraceae bacterium NSJ-54]|uniref:YhfC family intramembrane metalloprotease n=2 Tax=Zongyangia hominis TaxID=2763677 RepID=A0A926EEG9_9FIRM|nr:YhfC family intramembrane metalloprotease [Zongyangia hominis]